MIRSPRQKRLPGTGASRDPRVVITGRENMRLVLLGVFALAGLLCLVYLRAVGPDEEVTSGDGPGVEEEAFSSNSTPVDRFLTDFPAELDEVFAGIDSQSATFDEELERYIATATRKLYFAPSEDFRRLDYRDVRELTGGLAQGPETRVFTPAELRGGLYEIRGELVGDAFPRTFDGIPMICGIVRPETQLGVTADCEMGFIAHRSGEVSSGGELDERWRAGSWVALNGFYACEFYFWNKLSEPGLAPLLLAGQVNREVPSRQPPKEIAREELDRLFAEHDRYFETKLNDPPQGLALPEEVPPFAFETFAGLALAHRDDAELFASAPRFEKELVQKFYDDPQAMRGQRFLIEGTVAFTPQMRRIGSNAYRLESKQSIILDGRYGILWIDSPQRFDLKKDDKVLIEAWFVSRIYWRSGRGIVDKLYFVARDLRPFVPRASPGRAWWQQTLPVGIVIVTLGLVALFSILLFRDRRRSQEMMRVVVNMRQRRRARADQGPPASQSRE